MKKQYEKAIKWLCQKTNYRYFQSVREDSKGVLYFDCYIYCIKRQLKPNLWFCVDLDIDGTICKIKRICTY